MIYQEITATVKKKLNVIVVSRILDKGKTEIVSQAVYSNRIKVYEGFCEMGTCYAIRKGNEFKRPLLTYKTFTEYIRNGEAKFVHVASTGVFAGRYLVQIITVK
jgi:hypothetical protein